MLESEQTESEQTENASDRGLDGVTDLAEPRRSD